MKYPFSALGHFAALATAAADSCKTGSPWDFCTPLTWEPQHPTDASAAGSTPADCQNMCENMKGSPLVDSGAGKCWPVNLHGAAVGQKHDIWHSGTCHISMGPASADGHLGLFPMTQNDMLNIIDTSISKFGGNGHVAATGNMSCAGGTVTWWVDSGIDSVPNVPWS